MKAALGNVVPRGDNSVGLGWVGIPEAKLNDATIAGDDNTELEILVVLERDGKKRCVGIDAALANHCT